MVKLLMNTKKLGEFIKEKRRELRLTQEVLAKELNITQGYLTKIEQGSHIPSPDLMLEIAKRFRMRSGQIFEMLEDGDEEEDNEEVELDPNNPVGEFVKDSKIRLFFSREYLRKLSPKTWRQIAAIIREELEPPPDEEEG